MPFLTPPGTPGPPGPGTPINEAPVPLYKTGWIFTALKIVLTATIATLGVMTPSRAAAAIIQLAPTADTYVRGLSTEDDLNFGNAPNLNVQHRTNSPTQNVNNTQHTYLRFDVSAIGVNSIGQAQLTLTISENVPNSTARQLDWQFDLYGINNDNGTLESFIEGNGGNDNDPTGEITWDNASGTFPGAVDAPLTGTPPFVNTGVGAGQATLLGTALLAGNPITPFPIIGFELTFDSQSSTVTGLLDFLNNAGTDEAVTFMLVKSVAPAGSPAEQFVHTFYSTDSTDSNAAPPQLTITTVPEPTSAMILVVGVTAIFKRKRTS